MVLEVAAGNSWLCSPAADFWCSSGSRPRVVPVLMYWQCIGLVASFGLVTRFNQKNKARFELARQQFQNLLYFQELKLKNAL